MMDPVDEDNLDLFPAEFGDTDPFIERIPEWMVIDDDDAFSGDGDIAKQHDDYFWPHKNGCPICGSDAYVGFDRVECCLKSCQNFAYREAPGPYDT